jgi:hypothetical protein
MLALTRVTFRAMSGGVPQVHSVRARCDADGDRPSVTVMSIAMNTVRCEKGV